MSEEKYAPNCSQNAPRCDWWPDCWRCGFDRDEDERRKELLKTKGLRKGRKGLWQLRITPPDRGR